jgi:hypothetical protein
MVISIMTLPRMRRSEQRSCRGERFVEVAVHLAGILVKRKGDEFHDGRGDDYLRRIFVSDRSVMLVYFGFMMGNDGVSRVGFNE